MLAITNRARQILKTVLERSEAKQALLCVRLDLTSTRGGLQIDQERLGDESVAIDGERLLVMDPYTAEKCVDQVLDCNGQEFILIGSVS